jgi:hypothetical protein
MTAIRDLVFASPSRLRTAFSFLRYGRFQFPETQEEEERTLSRLMWKLGFSTRTYPTHHQRLWELIASVRTSASSADLSRDVDRQDIRGQASNLFVLLEEVLDLSLGFSTWALLSDHLAGSGFVYDPAIARRFMASRLDGVRGPDVAEPLVFDPGGRNTLFPLIQGFGALGVECRQILDQADHYERPRHDWPDLYAEGIYEGFPFPHTLAICDLRTGSGSRSYLAARYHERASSGEHLRPA